MAAIFRLLDASGAHVGYSELDHQRALESLPGRAWTTEGVLFTSPRFPESGRPTLPEGVLSFVTIPPSGNEAKAARKARAAWCAARAAEHQAKERRAAQVAAEVRVAALGRYLEIEGLDAEHRAEARRMMAQAQDTLRRFATGSR